MAGSQLGDALRSAALAADRQFATQAAATTTLVASAVNITTSQGLRGDGTVGPIVPPPSPIAADAATNAAALAAAIVAMTVASAGDPPSPAVTSLYDFATYGTVAKTAGTGVCTVTITGHNITIGSIVQFINPANTTYLFGTPVSLSPDGITLICTYDFAGQAGNWQCRNMTPRGTPSAFYLFTV